MVGAGARISASVSATTRFRLRERVSSPPSRILAQRLSRVDSTDHLVVADISGDVGRERGTARLALPEPRFRHLGAQ